jgi:hypothetical protein
MVDYMKGRPRRRCCCPGDNQVQPVAGAEPVRFFPAAPANQTPGIESHTLGEPLIRLMISEGARRPPMIWAGSAQEDHASGEMGSPSDGTVWHITSVLNTGAGPSPARTRSLRARPSNQAPACPELSRPSRLRRSHLQRPTPRSPAWCSGRRPRQAPAPLSNRAEPTDRPPRWRERPGGGR